MSLKTTAAKIALILIIGSSVALPLMASAAWSTPNIWGVPPGYWGPLVSCTGNYINAGTLPPCTSLCDLIDTIINVIYFGMSIAIFIIAPICIVIGGIMILLGGANPGMLESGKKALTGAIIGLIIVLCSYLIVNTVLTVLNLTGVGGFSNNTCTIL
jgi:hypothetical protein